jgi:hypothetical protein
MRLFRLAVMGIATLAAGGVLAGCGGGGGTASALAPGGSSGTATALVPGGGTVTKAQAAAYAQAVNLRATDLPRMEAGKPEHEGKAPSRLEFELARCDGALNPQIRVLNRVSPTFTPSSEGEGENEGEHEQIHSSVEVLPTQAIAAKNNAAQLSPHGLDCTRSLIPAAIANSDTRSVRYGSVTLRHLPNPLPGVPGSFAIEITMNVLGVPSQLAATPPHVYIDILGFLSGASEINLGAIGFPKPVTEATEQRLTETLYSRAHANKL